MTEIVLHSDPDFGHAPITGSKPMIYMEMSALSGKRFGPLLKPTGRFVKLRLGGSPLPAFPP
jgi:hypothetical protein